MAIDNCKKCGAIFQRMQNPNCRNCEEGEQNLKTELYRFIHDHPGIEFETLCERFNQKAPEMERMLFSGALGTASSLVSFKCARCKCEVSPSARVGHFCDNCQKNVSNEVNSGRRPEEPTAPPASQAASRSSSGGGMYTYKPASELPKSSPRQDDPPGRSNFGFKRSS